METFFGVFTWIGEHYQTLTTALVACCTSFITIFALIPGPQPEKTLQAVVDFISKFSKK